MRSPILTLSGVATDIGRYHILKDVDFAVERGKVTMLLGRNGVGKTTTLRTIMGLWRAKAGEIVLDGTDLVPASVSARAIMGIGYVPEDMGIFTDLTVEENMTLAALSGPIDRHRLDFILAAFPPLKTFWRSAAGNLSGGQKQMLSIARAIAEDRKLILIDEPTKGLAPAIVSTMVGALRELKRQGATILMVEQNVAVAKALGDDAVVMDDGTVVWTGTMDALAADADLQARLIGLSMEAH